MSAFRESVRGVAGHDGLAEKLKAYAARLLFYNKRINLVSRLDVDSLLDHHVAHCLRLAFRPFPAGSTVIDWGTGGGLPLLPLAIVFPDVQFVGVDAVEKKVRVVAQIARELELGNVEVWQGRAEKAHIAHTHSVSRATAPLAQLWQWHMRAAVDKERDKETPPGEPWMPGLICLKGGALQDEIAALQQAYRVKVAVESVGFEDPYYHDKMVVAVQNGIAGA